MFDEHLKGRTPTTNPESSSCAIEYSSFFLFRSRSFFFFSGQLQQQHQNAFPRLLAYLQQDTLAIQVLRWAVLGISNASLLLSRQTNNHRSIQSKNLLAMKELQQQQLPVGPVSKEECINCPSSLYLRLSELSFPLNPSTQTGDYCRDTGQIKGEVS